MEIYDRNVLNGGMTALILAKDYLPTFDAVRLLIQKGADNLFDGNICAICFHIRV